MNAATVSRECKLWWLGGGELVGSSSAADFLLSVAKRVCLVQRC